MRRLTRSANSSAMAYHGNMNKPYFVRAEWDSDACVWVASSDDVPGLVTEAATIEALDAKLQTMVPELLELNGCLPSGDSIQVELFARRFTTANLAHA
jgi:predicted RNase H-like HicB family nuclease